MNSMLVTQTRPEIVSKIFTDASGKRYKLTFAVALVNGELKGRLISAEEIRSLEMGDRRGEISHILCLPCARACVSPYSVLLTPHSDLNTPHYSLDYLITSQPTRAPSRN